MGLESITEKTNINLSTAIEKMVVDMEIKKNNFVRSFQKSNLARRNAFLSFATAAEKQQWGVLFYNVNQFIEEMEMAHHALQQEISNAQKNPQQNLSELKIKSEKNYLDFLKKYEQADTEFSRLDTYVSWLETKYSKKIAASNQRYPLEYFLDGLKEPLPLNISFPKLKTLHSEITSLLNNPENKQQTTFLKCIKEEIETKIVKMHELQKKADWKQTVSTVSFAVAAVSSGALNFLSLLTAVPLLNTIANPIKQIVGFIGYSFWGAATKEDQSLTMAEKKILSDHYRFMRKATLGSAATGLLGTGAVITSLFAAATLPWSLLVGTALLTISNFAWMATTFKELKYEIDTSPKNASRNARIAGYALNSIYAVTSTLGVALLVVGAVALAFSPPGLLAMAGVLAIAAITTLCVCIGSFLASKLSFFIASRQQKIEDSQKNAKYHPSLEINKPSLSESLEKKSTNKKKSLRSFTKFSPLQALTKETKKPEKWPEYRISGTEITFDEYQQVCMKLQQKIAVENKQDRSPLYQVEVLKPFNKTSDYLSQNKEQLGLTIAIPNSKNGKDILKTVWQEKGKSSLKAENQDAEKANRKTTKTTRNDIEKREQKEPIAKPEFQITLSRNAEDKAIFFMMENFANTRPLKLNELKDPKTVLKLLEAAKASGWNIQEELNPEKLMPADLQIDQNDLRAILNDPEYARQYKSLLSMDVEKLTEKVKSGLKLGETFIERPDTP